MARVSVIIPVRNQATYLRESLASVFAQRYRDIEVIVIDDGSSEDLGPALAPYAPSLRLERQVAAGVAAARNRGAAIASGDFLAFHDADDRMEADRIAAPLARLDAVPSLALVFGNGTQISASGRPLGAVIPPRQARRLVRRGLQMRDLLRRSLVYLQGSLIRRDVFDQLGGFPRLAAGSDWAFILRCALQHSVGYIDKPLFRYRQHPTSITSAKVEAAAAAVTVLRGFVAYAPSVVERVGQRHVNMAIARRLGRLATQEQRAGDMNAARTHLEEAAALAPYMLKYRLRLLRLRPRAACR